MFVSIIAAIDRRGLIGDESGLPWHLPKDLRRFRAYTWGKPMIMGRRTYELIGKPLPGRFSIVLSHHPEYHPPGCRVARTFQEALFLAEDHLRNNGGDEIMVIGGGKVYAEAILRWNRLYLTVVEGEFQGSAFFPIRELLRQAWRPVCEPETHVADEKNFHPHSFHVIERVSDAAPSSARWVNDRPSPEFQGPEEFSWEGDLIAILRRGTMVS